MKTYIISLAGETQRREHIIQECARFHIEPEIVDAVDMRQATAADIERLSRKITHWKPKKQRWLSKGELGCALSHHQVYQKIVDNQDDFALILEDDAEFIANPHVLLNSGSLKDIYQQYPFDVLLIGYVKILPQYLPYFYRCIPIKTHAQLHGFRFGTPWAQYACGTVAYIITQQGAKKLLSATTQPCATADDWLYFEQKLDLKILHSRPAFVLENLQLDSTIRQDTHSSYYPKFSSQIIRSIKGCLKNIAMNYLRFK
ncbi:MAG: glycosyltransferase family 25 protein [Alysiella sp.]|uniref:glycosyltransferase family 25 protein n=1 Tax=Alysiella sp. TaxID=1872483 RepID=UPI0026DAF85A|nr:glycosyltransferase family 25 protein [Alysiella sp.]MDO4433563.1 glycosyltransferase family 25 protein [Alysiella sp.]